jgi:hypothetical protein
VVEVLEQREVERQLQLGVGLVAGQPRGEVHRHLLVADRGLQRGQVSGEEPVDGLLLVLVGAAVHGQGLTQRAVVGVAVELVGEHDRLHLDAVHQDDAAAGVRISRGTVDRVQQQVVPRPELVCDGDALLAQRVEGHGNLGSLRGWGTPPFPRRRDGYARSGSIPTLHPTRGGDRARRPIVRAARGATSIPTAPPF